MQRWFWQYPKQWISYSLTIVWYILMIYFLFVQLQLLYGAIALLGLTIVLHFSLISIQASSNWIGYRQRAVWIGVSAAILGLITDHSTLLIIVSYLLFHMGLLFLLGSKRDALNNNITTAPWAYCNAGMYVFSVFVTLSYGILMLGVLGNIPFDCDSIAHSPEKTDISRPRERISESAQSRRETTATQSPKSANGALAQLREEIENLELRDGITTQRQQINRSICLTVFESIQNQLQKPWFQAIILFPLFILLSPIVRIVFYMLSIVTLILMQVFLKTKIYRKRKVLREVDEWY